MMHVASSGRTGSRSGGCRPRANGNSLSRLSARSRPRASGWVRGSGFIRRCLRALIFGTWSERWSTMASTFKPPPRARLSEVDVAEGVSYDRDGVVVEGVVSPRGQSCWAGRAKTYDVHLFSLAAWRLPRESLVSRELTLLRPVPPARDGEERESNVFEDFPQCSIQRLSVLLDTDRTRGIVEKVLTLERPDQELLAFSEQLKRPVVISTKQF